MALAIKKWLVELLTPARNGDQPLQPDQAESNVLVTEWALNELKGLVDGNMAPEDYVNLITSVGSPRFHVALQHDLAFLHGVGSATFTRAAEASYRDIYGDTLTAVSGEVRYVDGGVELDGGSANDLLQSEIPEDAVWTKVAVTVNSKKITETTATGVHDLKQTKTYLADDYTYWVDVTPEEREFVQLIMYDGTDYHYATFDILNETYSNELNITQARIRKLANGDYRCSITAPTSAGTGNIDLRLKLDASTSNYTGDGVSGLTVHRQSCTNMPFEAPYVPTTISVLTRIADYVRIPRYGNLPNLNRELAIIMDCKFLGFKYGVSHTLLTTTGTGTDIFSVIVLSTGKVRLFDGIEVFAETVLGAVDDSDHMYRIGIVRDSDGLWSIYVDGELKSTPAASSVEFLNDRQYVQLHGSAAASTGYWVRGAIRFYSRAFSANQMGVI